MRLSVAAGAAMSRKINGDYVIFFVQTAVLMRPGTVITARAVDKKQARFFFIEITTVNPAGNFC